MFGQTGMPASTLEIGPFDADPAKAVEGAAVALLAAVAAAAAATADAFATSLAVVLSSTPLVVPRMRDVLSLTLIDAFAPHSSGLRPARPYALSDPENSVRAQACAAICIGRLRE